jgi:hypothetical protein
VERRWGQASASVGWPARLDGAENEAGAVGGMLLSLPLLDEISSEHSAPDPPDSATSVAKASEL